jgi:hypothetical protein
MFTDDLATPTRVETLLDLLRSPPKRRWTDELVAEMLQPEGLPGVKEKRAVATKMIAAASELGLVERGKENLKLTFSADDSRSTPTILREAIDSKILAGLDIEPYFAPFFSFLLGLDAEADVKRNLQQWVDAFLPEYPKASGPNPFNKTKLTGLRRWFSYAGLGWYDSSDTFQCNPYARLLRRLPAIFKKKRELPADEFMRHVANSCPELDGGEIFTAVNTRYTPTSLRCTLGLSRALVELHLDGILRLHCPTDSSGWWIDGASPPRDREYILSDRIDRLSWNAGETANSEGAR